MATNLEGLQQLNDALTTLAPKLAPNCSTVLPEDALEVLDRLYEGEGLKAKLKNYQEAFCPLCGGEMAAQTWDVDWEAEITKRRIKPRKCRLICKVCAEIRDLRGLINKFCFEKDKEHSSTLQHFLQVNGHDVADSHCFQDAVSVAYASSVLRKELKLTPSRGPPLQDLLGTEDGLQLQSKKRTVEQPLSQSPKGKRSRGKK
ncbi:unnamed protein product [Effrenium voratum]|uniref:Uncharacterized protein n=1 Tax=Effrenium voratum TaxID=2562239 RepID=A0AA36N6E2_9DINO|nr:unnamed protein product [Effrenium voratum]